MRYKFRMLLVLGFVALGLLINSCKKDNSDTVAYFLTAGTWQLASVQTEYLLGNNSLHKDTLNLTCNLNQVFQFNSNNTCTLSNYHCIAQTSSGSWQLGPDNLSLQTTMSAKDTLKAAVVTVKAFDNAVIQNLGQYSLVLKTGDTSPYYLATTARKITTYGFVHVLNN